MRNLTGYEIQDLPPREREFYLAARDYVHETRGDWKVVPLNSPAHRSWEKYLTAKNWEPFARGHGILVVPARKPEDFDPDYFRTLREAKQRDLEKRKQWLSSNATPSAS